MGLYIQPDVVDDLKFRQWVEEDISGTLSALERKELEKPEHLDYWLATIKQIFREINVHSQNNKAYLADCALKYGKKSEEYRKVLNEYRLRIASRQKYISRVAERKKYVTHLRKNRTRIFNTEDVVEILDNIAIHLEEKEYDRALVFIDRILSNIDPQDDEKDKK